MKINIRLLFTALSLFSSIAYAQTTLKGTVIDENDEPLTGANVILSPTKGTTTDFDGNYSITNIIEGSYTVKVSFLGFKSQSKTIKISGQDTITVNFSLTESNQQLQAVEITGRLKKSYKNDVSFAATKTATAIKDIPQAVSYVTKEVFADQQAYTINDIVKNISGVSQFSYYDDFVLRGFRSGDFYINGLRVLDLFGPNQLLANFERVEVVKGPASATFGNASPGGIMNRVTKKPLTEDRKAINFTLGSFNTLRTTADFTGPINEKKTLLYRLNLAYENSDSFRNLQEFKSYMIAPSISFLPSDKTSVNFDLVISNYDGKLDRGQPIFGATAGTDLNSTPISFAIGQTNDFQKTDVVYSTLSLNHQFSDKLSFNTSYIKSLIEEDLQEHVTSNQFAIDGNGDPIPTLMGLNFSQRQKKTTADNITSYFVYKNNTKNLDHKIVVGFDYNQEKQPIGKAQSRAQGYLLQGGGTSSKLSELDNFLRDEDGNPIPNVPHFDLENPTYRIARTSDYIISDRTRNASKYYTYGFYIQDQINWNKFQFLLGGRQEYYVDIVDYEQLDEKTTTQNKFLPRLGIVYSATKDINVYGTYTESFEPQRASNINNPLAGGPFDPESAFMIETGAKGEFFNNRLAANIAVYYIQNNNILIDANNVENPDLLRQRGQEESKGFELDINGRILPNFSLTANYAYNETIISESDVVEEIGRQKENAPKHQGGFFGKYTFNRGQLDGIGLSLGTNFVSERNTFEETLKLPSYTIMDAGVSYNIDKFNIRFLIKNFFDKTHWVGGYRYTRLFPGAPRNYLLSVGYTF
ncbi:TonB-dependent receptor [Aequorivita sp. CIP111184]|uniref:TonB-dependent receptor n=1 Tax=Aequorivita sp. CIP111184 TaxID=2211356 RepID=UPI000DBC2489|nr:TonB-dependent receptor [Aequorivita sp. CIP111184]SRX53875.1 Ferrichrome-iron receptor [Aequorivita sp. CIP111184]